MLFILLSSSQRHNACPNKGRAKNGHWDMHLRAPRCPDFAVQIGPIEPILTTTGVESAGRRRYHPPPQTTRHQEGDEPNKLSRKRLK